MSNDLTVYKEEDVNERLQEALDLVIKASPVLLSEKYLCSSDELLGKKKSSASEIKHQEMHILREVHLKAKEEGTLISKTIKSTNGISCPACSSKQIYWADQEKLLLKCRHCFCVFNGI